MCEKLVTAYLLGGNFFDIVFNPMKPGERIVELDDGTNLPIIMKRPKRVEESVLIPNSLQDSQQEGRLSQNILITRTVSSRPKR